MKTSTLARKTRQNYGNREIINKFKYTKTRIKGVEVAKEIQKPTYSILLVVTFCKAVDLLR